MCKLLTDSRMLDRDTWYIEYPCSLEQVHRLVAQCARDGSPLLVEVTYSCVIIALHLYCVVYVECLALVRAPDTSVQ